MTFEEEYEDVLQNIEATIVGVYRQRSDLIDYDVEEALDGLIGRYKAEQRDREPRSPQMTEKPLALYEAVEDVCEWRLGRKDLWQEGTSQPEPKTIEEIIACLKRIKRSVGKWHKRGGRQGYLHFIEQYIP